MLAGLCANVAHADITGTPVTSIHYGYLSTGFTVDEEGVAVMQPAIARVSNSDIEVTIFSQQYNEEKTFTLKNVVGENIVADGTVTQLCDELNISTCDFPEVVVTRNFFVKNDKWCVLLQTYDGPYLSWGDSVTYTVVCEDGTNLGALTDINGDISFVLDNFYCGKPYLKHYDYELEDVNSQLFTFTGTSSLDAVKVSSTKVYPNPVAAGGTVTIELNKPADDNTKLIILDMNGRRVKRETVKPGEEAVRVNNRFAHGHYIYNVVYGDGTVDSGRLMAD